MRCGLRLAAMVVALLLPATTTAQDTQQLPDLSLEELMRISIARVFGASQRLQSVTEAPASVSIVTADDISRYGYRTLADMLSGVRGLYVSDDRNYSYVGVRGFARPGDYNTRILLLINGHRVNDNIFDQAGMGGELGLDPAMFERVEIIRGPASSLYGTNALFAVVNVITKTGSALNGGSVTVEGGTFATRRVNLAYGRRLSGGLDLALSGTYQGTDGPARIYFPAFDHPDTNAGIAEGLDGEELRQVYGRASFKNVTVTGAVGYRDKTIPTASFETGFNEQDVPESTVDQRTLLDAQYERAFGVARFALRGAFDRYAYDGVYPFPLDEAGPLVNYDSATGTRWGIDGRLTRAAPGRQVVTLGFEFFDNVEQTQRNTYDRPSDLEFTIERSSRQGAAYVQDAIRLHGKILLDVGARLDRFNNDNRLSPRAAVIFTQSQNQSLKYVYGNAFRAPNVHEREYHSAGVTNGKLRPESIDTHEAVWERYTGEWLRSSVSTYWYRAKQLISLTEDPTTFDGLSFVNVGDVRSQGVEFEAEVRSKNGIHGLASYTTQRARDWITKETLTNSPRHLAKLRFSVPLAGVAAGSAASLEVHYLSRRGTLAGRDVNAVAVAHLTVVGRVRPGLDVVGSIRNLFDQDYADPASDEHRQDSIPRDGRTIRAGLRWTFLSP
jgi:iron complex outermembrane receptor protein